MRKTLLQTLDVTFESVSILHLAMQAIEGHKQVIAYGSRALTKAERKYYATRRELLALVWGVHHFRLYLYGRRFIARTDHNSCK